MALQIHNTMSQKKEAFVPLKPGVATMYVCGPTVYGYLHVGNFRGPVFYNLVRNWLEKNGYKVEYAYNYTDVDDKIIERANREGVESSALAAHYITEFEKDFAALKLTPHTYNPKVTETMEPIVKMIDDLVKAEKAYKVESGEVLYSVRSFNEYGKLSHKNIDDLQSGARVEIDQKKRDPLDFALWKPAKPGEPKWPSPWCDGRPGWHIECSAMARAIFGESIDIHGGGMDLIFPHHENEIAQSEGATGKPFARYWMHNNMLTFGDKKMSKSLGNIMTARDFLAKYDGEILKYMLLSVHYRSLSDFSEQAVGFAVNGLARVYSSLNLAEKTIAAGQAAGVQPGAVSKSMQQTIEATTFEAARALDDDFNTPELFAAIYGMTKAFNSQVRLGQKMTPELLATAQAFRAWILEYGQLLSLFQESPEVYLRGLDDRLLSEKKVERAHVDGLIAERNEVRTAKNFARSDELRAELTALGIAIQDTPQGTFWEVAK